MHSRTIADHRRSWSRGRGTWTQIPSASSRAKSPCKITHLIGSGFHEWVARACSKNRFATATPIRRSILRVNSGSNSQSRYIIEPSNSVEIDQSGNAITHTWRVCGRASYLDVAGGVFKRHNDHGTSRLDAFDPGRNPEMPRVNAFRLHISLEADILGPNAKPAVPGFSISD